MTHIFTFDAILNHFRTKSDFSVTVINTVTRFGPKVDQIGPRQNVLNLI